MRDIEEIAQEIWQQAKIFQDYLLPRLRDGSLIGIGYIEPQKSGDKPRIIPKEAWIPEKINWNKASLKYGKRRYILIRFSESHNKPSIICP